MNAIQGKRRTRCLALKPGNQTTLDPTTIADTLADYFGDLSFFHRYPLDFRKKKHQPTSAALAVTQVPGFSVQNVNKEFSIDELLFDLRKAKAKSVGLDQIGYPMLKKIPPM